MNPLVEYSKITSSPESASSQSPDPLPNLILKLIVPPELVFKPIVVAVLLDPAKYKALPVTDPQLVLLTPSMFFHCVKSIPLSKLSLIPVPPIDATNSVDLPLHKLESDAESTRFTGLDTNTSTLSICVQPFADVTSI